MKLRTLLLFGMILALLLAGCSRSTPTPEAAPVAEEPAATPADAADEPADEAATDGADEGAAEGAAEGVAEGETAAAQTAVITVGVNAQFEPFVYLDANGNLAGFDIDIMNALNAVMDFEVAYENTTFEALFTDLESGQIDAAISAITVTDARKERVDFTEPYFASGLSPVSYFSAGQSLANTTAEIVPFEESTPLLQALVNGDIDAVILDAPVIIRFIKSNPGASIKLTGGPITEEVYAIAVGKERPQVLDGLNEGLQIIQEDGTYDAIYTKWFGAP
jgi:ABC-type amino acid transport substrate-binding protein